MRYMKCLLLLCFASSIATSATGEAPETLVEKGHFKQAKVILERRLAAEPKDVDAMILLARVNLAYNTPGNVGEAKKLLQQAVALQPRTLAAHLYLADAYSRNTNELGLFEKARVAKVIRSETEQALAIDPNNLDALKGMMQFYLEAPGVMGGSSSKALELAGKIAGLDPVKGTLAYGAIAIHEKNFTKAESIYLKGIEANPRSYEILIELSSLYLRDQFQNYDKAEPWAARAMQVDPSRVAPYSILAIIYSSGERWADLDQMMPKVDKLVSDNLSPYYSAGRVLAISGKDNPRAERYFRKYLTQEPEPDAPSLAGAHWRLGQVLEREGKKQEAIQEIQAAVQLKPDLKGAQDDLKRLRS